MIDERILKRMFEHDLKSGDRGAIGLVHRAIVEGIKQGVDTAMRDARGGAGRIYGDSETDDGEGGQNADDYFGLLLWGE